MKYSDKGYILLNIVHFYVHKLFSHPLLLLNDAFSVSCKINNIFLCVIYLYEKQAPFKMGLLPLFWFYDILWYFIMIMLNLFYRCVLRHADRIFLPYFFLIAIFSICLNVSIGFIHFKDLGIEVLTGGLWDLRKYWIKNFIWRYFEQILFLTFQTNNILFIFYQRHVPKVHPESFPIP